MNVKAKIRCAIYTRKSHEDGLEQEYNSLDAQRDAGINYINSQRHEGWIALPMKYDDGGFIVFPLYKITNMFYNMPFNRGYFYEL